MTIDPKRIAAWCSVPIAVGGLLVYLGSTIDARAQEVAREAAQEELTQQIAPMQSQLEELVRQGRVREDREALIFCLDRQYPDLSAEERRRRCQAESDIRWARWAWDDCAEAKGAEQCGPRP